MPIVGILPGVGRLVDPLTVNYYGCDCNGIATC